MINWRVEEILVLAKAYPTPSTKYGETVCTAGVTRSGEWIRLYPITFRDLPFDKRYEKFQWIKARITSAKEKLSRPESYKVDLDSIKLLEKIPYSFHYKFVCNDASCKSHDLTIVDWDINQTYRHFKETYKSEELIKEKLKDKWFNYFFSRRESYFVVGTDSNFGKFMILTVISPKRKDPQLSLFG
jgi:hypothetical protein